MAMRSFSGLVRGAARHYPATTGARSFSSASFARIGDIPSSASEEKFDRLYVNSALTSLQWVKEKLWLIKGGELRQWDRATNTWEDTEYPGRMATISQNLHTHRVGDDIYILSRFGTTLLVKRLNLAEQDIYNARPPVSFLIDGVSDIVGDTLYCFGEVMNHPVDDKAPNRHLLKRPLHGYSYNITNAKWSKLELTGDLPITRNVDRMALARAGDKLYLFSSPVLPQETLDVHEFDPRKSSWRKLAPSGSVPPRLVFYSLTRLGDKILLSGGQEADTNPLLQPKFNENLYCFDPAANSWTKVNTSGQTPDPRSFPVVIPSAENKFILMGGIGRGSAQYVMTGQDNDDRFRFDIYECSLK